MTDPVKVRLPTFKERPISESGTFVPAWFQFFTNIYARVGGATDAVAPASAFTELATVGTIERQGTDLYATYTVTTFAKSLLDDEDAATALTTLGAAATNSPTLATPSLTGLGNYVDDTAAAAGSVPVGGVYRNGSVLMIRVT